MGSDSPEAPPVNDSQYVNRMRHASPTPMVAMEKYGPRKRRSGCAVNDSTPATMPPAIHAGCGGRWLARISLPATKPPMPNIAEWPKLTWPAKPPIQFHASAPVTVMNARVMMLCRSSDRPMVTGSAASAPTTATNATMAHGGAIRARGGVIFAPARRVGPAAPGRSAEHRSRVADLRPSAPRLSPEHALAEQAA